jgi:hypothetical protein
MTVGHGAREDQAGKGYFLIGDGVADFIFRHRWLLEFERSFGQKKTRRSGILDWLI